MERVLSTHIHKGRKQKLSLADDELPTIPDKSAEINFEMRLRRWIRNYIILLKLAQLELKGLSRTRQITELATWRYQDSSLVAPP